jgi:hypothetical protein
MEAPSSTPNSSRTTAHRQDLQHVTFSDDPQSTQDNVASTATATARTYKTNSAARQDLQQHSLSDNRAEPRIGPTAPTANATAASTTTRQDLQPHNRFDNRAAPRLGPTAPTANATAQDQQLAVYSSVKHRQRNRSAYLDPEIYATSTTRHARLLVPVTNALTEISKGKPLRLHQILRTAEKEVLLEAMEEEFGGLWEMGTFLLIEDNELPAGVKPLPISATWKVSKTSDPYR